MAEINPAIAMGQPPPGQINPLETLGKIAPIIGQLNQNRLFQQEFQSRQAIGQAMQQSVNPETGQPDFNKAILLMATNPQAAWAAPGFAKQLFEMGKAQQEVVAKQIENSQARAGIIGGAITPLAAKGQTVTRGDVLDSIARLYARTGDEQVLSQKQLTDVAASLPDDKPVMGPDGRMHNPLADYINGLARQTENARAALESFTKQMAIVSTPQGPQFVRQTPAGPQIVGQIENQPSPAERSALVPMQDAQGVTHQVPRQEVPGAPMFGGAGSQVTGGVPPIPVGEPGGGQGAPVPQPPVGTQGGAAPAGAPAATPLVGKISPSQEQYLHDRGKNMADFEKELNAQSDLYISAAEPRLRAMLESVRHFKAGPGGDFRKMMGQYLFSIGATKAADAVNGGPGALSAMMEFEKNSVVNSAALLRSALGSGQRIAVQELLLFLESNPRVGTTPQAIEAMIKLQQFSGDLMLLQQQKLDEYKQTHPDPSGFPAWWSRYVKDHKLMDRASAIVKNSLPGAPSLTTTQTPAGSLGDSTGDTRGQ